MGGRRSARSWPIPCRLTSPPEPGNHHHAGDVPVRPFPPDSRRHRSWWKSLWLARAGMASQRLRPWTSRPSALVACAIRIVEEAGACITACLRHRLGEALRPLASGSKPMAWKSWPSREERAPLPNLPANGSHCCRYLTKQSEGRPGAMTEQCRGGLGHR